MKGHSFLPLLLPPASASRTDCPPPPLGRWGLRRQSAIAFTCLLVSTRQHGSFPGQRDNFDSALSVFPFLYSPFSLILGGLLSSDRSESCASRSSTILPSFPSQHCSLQTRGTAPSAGVTPKPASSERTFTLPVTQFPFFRVRKGASRLFGPVHTHVFFPREAGRLFPLVRRLFTIGKNPPPFGRKSFPPFPGYCMSFSFFKNVTTRPAQRSFFFTFGSSPPLPSCTSLLFFFDDEFLANESL